MNENNLDDTEEWEVALENLLEEVDEISEIDFRALSTTELLDIDTDLGRIIHLCELYLNEAPVDFLEDIENIWNQAQEVRRDVRNMLGNIIAIVNSRTSKLS